MQISLSQSRAGGLSYTLNYTWSKLMDNTGTGRTAYSNNQREWSLSTTDLPQKLSAFGVWEEPFGKGGGIRFVNTIIKSFSISGIYRYTAGVPLVPIAASCNQPFSGSCEPSYNPLLPARRPASTGATATRCTVSLPRPPT